MQLPADSRCGGIVRRVQEPNGFAGLERYLDPIKRFSDAFASRLEPRFLARPNVEERSRPFVGRQFSEMGAFPGRKEPLHQLVGVSERPNPLHIDPDHAAAGHSQERQVFTMSQIETKTAGGEPSRQRRFPMRAVFELDSPGFGAQITAQHPAKNTASGNEPVPVALEVKAFRAPAFVSRKRRRQATQRRRRDAK
jgi:hypothetical protein